jgi:hypothetical protein
MVSSKSAATFNQYSSKSVKNCFKTKLSSLTLYNDDDSTLKIKKLVGRKIYQCYFVSTYVLVSYGFVMLFFSF